MAGDYNVTPADEDVWDPVKAHGGTHVSEPERAALARLRDWGLADGYRVANPDAKGRLLVVGLPGRNVPPQRGHADRPALRRPAGRRSGSPGPRSTARRARARRCRRTMPRSSLDLDERGKAFEAGWEGALARIASRTRPSGKRSPAQVRYEEEREERNKAGG